MSISVKVIREPNPIDYPRSWRFKKDGNRIIYILKEPAEYLLQCENYEQFRSFDWKTWYFVKELKMMSDYLLGRVYE